MIDKKHTSIIDNRQEDVLQPPDLGHIPGKQGSIPNFLGFYSFGTSGSRSELELHFYE